MIVNDVSIRIEPDVNERCGVLIKTSKMSQKQSLNLAKKLT